jgi:hypothetical protein
MTRSTSGETESNEAAYITIVEGPPPEFRAANHPWTASLAEGPDWTAVASCEMRTFNGQDLVERCRGAWRDGRPARLDYPVQMMAYAPPSGRAEVEIVAARWRDVPEGQVLTLWVRTDKVEQIEGGEQEADDA